MKKIFKLAPLALLVGATLGQSVYAQQQIVKPVDLYQQADEEDRITVDNVVQRLTQLTADQASSTKATELAEALKLLKDNKYLEDADVQSVYRLIDFNTYEAQKDEGKRNDAIINGLENLVTKKTTEALGQFVDSAVTHEMTPERKELLLGAYKYALRQAYDNVGTEVTEEQLEEAARLINPELKTDYNTAVGFINTSEIGNLARKIDNLESEALDSGDKFDVLHNIATNNAQTVAELDDIVNNPLSEEEKAYYTEKYAKALKETYEENFKNQEDKATEMAQQSLEDINRVDFNGIQAFINSADITKLTDVAKDTAQELFNLEEKN